MAWLKTLAETYDACSDLVGVVKNDQPVLLPLSHSTFNAQIEVMIDAEGNFCGSKKLDKGSDIVTIIPVTEDSATRSGKTPPPHPLCDKLCYVAGDYTLYTGDEKEKYYEAYMKQLWDWVESEDTHPMVQSVYRYLEKRSLIQDLVRDHTLELDEENRLTDIIKIQDSGQTGANVRFVVFGNEIPWVWQNQSLYEKYSRYYKRKNGETRLCYVTGNWESCSEKHPSKIRNSGDMTRLISGNDKKGFTYRGRFTAKNQVVSIGYEVSQKAHNALKWLIQKQGYTRDGSAIVCWMTNRDMQIPDMMRDSINAYYVMDDFNFDDIDELEWGNTYKHDTGKYFAEQFNRAVNGYARKIKVDDRVAVIALDATNKNKGRLSITYYDEMGAKQYMNALLYWQQHCAWKRSVKVGSFEDDKKRITCEFSPAPRDMALAAFGTQKSQKSKRLEADSKLLRTAVNRLLPCITKPGVKIPEDFIRAAARRASMPQSMSDFVWHNDVLCVVCAMIRFNYERGGGTMSTFLEDNVGDRNVLFGRLLAVYDYMEQRAMFGYDENGKPKEGRTTNAKRYWNVYSSRPAKTLKTIKQNLIPYEKRLSDFELRRFEEWTGEIMAYLAGEGFDNKPLSEMYLPGYYLQIEYMKDAFHKKE